MSKYSSVTHINKLLSVTHIEGSGNQKFITISNTISYLKVYYKLPQSLLTGLPNSLIFNNYNNK